jgi:hypothetical protein
LQLPVVVADVADAMGDIEGRHLLAAAVGPTANRSQCIALHSEIAAALLIGAGRQPLCVRGKAEPNQHRRREQSR